MHDFVQKRDHRLIGIANENCGNDSNRYRSRGGCYAFLSPVGTRKLRKLRKLHAGLNHNSRCNFNFSDGDERFRGVRPLIDVLLQRGQVRLRHSGGRWKLFEERHRAEASAAASEAVPGGGHKSLREAHFLDLRRRLQEKVGHRFGAIIFRRILASLTIAGVIPKVHVSLSTVVSNFKTRT